MKFFIILLFFLISCDPRSLVDRLLEASRDPDVAFDKPRSSYVSTEHKDLDHLWMNEDKGTSLSYISKCLPFLPDLETLEGLIMSAFQISEYVQESKSLDLPYENKNVVFKEADIEGVTEIVLIKDSSCYYSIQFVASSEESYEKERHVLDKFVESFQP